MNNQKVKLRLVVTLLIVSLLISSTVLDSFAVEPVSATTSNYENISVATTGYFAMCEETLQEKLTNSSYITDQYTRTSSPIVTSISYDIADTVSELQTLTNSRATGILNYIESVDIRIMSWNTFVGEPENVVISENGEIDCNVYVWTEFEWCNSDFPEPIQSGFGTLHTLTLTSDFQVIADLFDEQDISGINTRIDSSVKDDISIRNYASNEGITPYAITPSSPTQLINRSSLVTYANQYVGNYSSGSVKDYTHYNRKYKNFNISGGDCANYVSQCLNNAGLPQISNWTYNENGTTCSNSSHTANNNTSYSTHSCTSNDSAGAAWTSVSSFISTMSSAYPSDYDTSPTVSNFYVGDVGFLCRGANGTSPYHAFICVATSSSTILVNAHNNDRKNVPYSNSSISSETNNISRIHIHSPSGSWQQYNSSRHRSPCNTGCGYYYYGSHFAKVPGQNATCLGCGYVGNISNGNV